MVISGSEFGFSSVGLVALYGGTFQYLLGGTTTFGLAFGAHLNFQRKGAREVW